MAFGRRRHEEHENNERWLVSYADFITLLFAFFAVLYATSQADLKKQEEFEKSFKEKMSGIGILGVGSTPGTGQAEQFAEHKEQFKNIIRPLLDTFPPAGAGPQEVKEHVTRRLERDLAEQERKAAVAGMSHDAVGVKIQLAASKLFASGSAELRADSAVALDRIGQILKESNRRIIVEGHTDDLPIHNGKFSSNWDLASARATKIVRYLAARHKIPTSHLVSIAYADQKPLVPNTNEENRAKNRRIEIKIVTGNTDI